MTLREQVQQNVQQLQDMYENANRMRDLATGEEKQYWNAFRGKLMAAWEPMQVLDDSLSQERADCKI